MSTRISVGKSVMIVGNGIKTRGRDDKGMMILEKFPCDELPNAADPLAINKSPAMIMPNMILCISAIISDKKTLSNI